MRGHKVCITTVLSTNATNSLPKAMKICYGQLSYQEFRQNTDALDSVIKVLKSRSNQDILKILNITASLYPVNLTLTKIDRRSC